MMRDSELSGPKAFSSAQIRCATDRNVSVSSGNYVVSDIFGVALICGDKIGRKSKKV